MTIYTDSTLQTILDTDAYTAPDGTKFPPAFPKEVIQGLRVVTETPRPNDQKVNVLGFHIACEPEGVPYQVWDTRPETADEIKQETNGPLLTQLDAIDSKSIRAIRAISHALANAMTPDAADISTIESLKTKSDALRAQLIA